MSGMFSFAHLSYFLYLIDTTSQLGAQRRKWSSFARNSHTDRLAAFARLPVMRAVFVAFVLLLSPSVYADEPASRPFADSLQWGAVAAGAAAFDHATSVSWSSRPIESFTLNTCKEGNLSQANTDGTINGPKAALTKGAIVAGLTGVLYATKKLHWKKAELVTKAVIGVQASQWAYYGFRSLAVCR